MKNSLHLLSLKSNKTLFVLNENVIKLLEIDNNFNGY